MLRPTLVVLAYVNVLALPAAHGEASRRPAPSAATQTHGQDTHAPTSPCTCWSLTFLCTCSGLAGGPCDSSEGAQLEWDAAELNVLFPSSAANCQGTLAAAPCAHTCAEGFEGGSVTCGRSIIGANWEWQIEPCHDIDGCQEASPDPDIEFAGDQGGCGTDVAGTTVTASCRMSGRRTRRIPVRLR